MKPKIPTPNEFAEVFKRIRSRRFEVFNHGEAVIDAKQHLAVAKAGHVLGGIEGRNQAERDARLEALVETEVQTLFEAEAKLRDANFFHDLDVLELDSLKYQLRAAEAWQRLEAVALEGSDFQEGPGR